MIAFIIIVVTKQLSAWLGYLECPSQSFFVQSPLISEPVQLSLPLLLPLSSTLASPQRASHRLKPMFKHLHPPFSIDQLGQLGLQADLVLLARQLGVMNPLALQLILYY